ncbi:hypothetical protein HMPREF0569_1888, partial [Micrococcus luteus SK58]
MYRFEHEPDRQERCDGESIGKPARGAAGGRAGGGGPFPRPMLTGVTVSHRGRIFVI